MKRKYTIEMKLRVVQEAKVSSISFVSSKYKIDRKRVRDWMAQEETLSLTDAHAFRIQGGGQRPNDATLEEILVERILDERHEKNRVTRSMITSWATEMSGDAKNNLSFSHGWLDRFLNRHDFVLRRATNKPSLSDAELVERAARFVLHTKSLISKYNIQPENIYSLDETALFFDHTDGRTVHLRGA
jgi:transposase-like protein